MLFRNFQGKSFEAGPQTAAVGLFAGFIVGSGSSWSWPGGFSSQQHQQPHTAGEHCFSHCYCCIAFSPPLFLRAKKLPMLCRL